ncbi:hypothetical protein LZ30DRAFT_84178 [Colletotrichum cereale]|nr:hypothetical protein LZ30DRAFT_84178 [Colletotrichum cereale]
MWTVSRAWQSGTSWPALCERTLRTERGRAGQFPGSSPECLSAVRSTDASHVANTSNVKSCMGPDTTISAGLPGWATLTRRPTQSGGGVRRCLSRLPIGWAVCEGNGPLGVQMPPVDWHHVHRIRCQGASLAVAQDIARHCVTGKKERQKKKRQVDIEHPRRRSQHLSRPASCGLPCCT